MKLHRLKDFRPAHTDYICRSSAVSALIISIVAVSIIVAVAIFQFPPERWWRWIIYVFMALFAWMFFGIFRRSLGPQNWLLAFDGSNVAIKFRSFLNAHFPDDAVVILTLERREIAWLRRSKETLVLQSDDRGGGSETRSLRYLDIGLQESVDTTELAAALKAERLEKAPGTVSKSKYHDHPVRLVEYGRVLRINWMSQASGVKPSLKKALQRLSSLAPVIEPTKSHTDFRPGKTEKTDQESRILDLIERGEIMAAIKLTRSVYNISLTEAREFVKGLQSR